MYSPSLFIIIRTFSYFTYCLHTYCNVWTRTLKHVPIHVDTYECIVKRQTLIDDHINKHIVWPTFDMNYYIMFDIWPYFYAWSFINPKQAYTYTCICFSFNNFEYFGFYKYKSYSGMHEYMRTLRLLCVWRESKFWVKIWDGDFSPFATLVSHPPWMNMRFKPYPSSFRSPPQIWSLAALLYSLRHC